MTPHQANLFFIAEYVLTILILAFSAYRKNAFDWRKTIRRKTFIKRMLFLIPVALIAIGIMTAAYLLQLPQKGQQKGQRNEEGERIRNGLAELYAHKTQHPGQYKNQRDKAHALPAAGQKGGTPGLAHALKGHVGHYDHRMQKDGKALVTEGGQRHGGDFRVIPEQMD